MNEGEITHLLWTGGWDSTFRLLELLLIEKKTVVPHYIIGEERRSFPVEMLTMASIRRELKTRYPQDSVRLYPTRFFNKAAIAENRSITSASKRIRKQVRLSSQYDWISRYCYQHHLKNVELSVIEQADPVPHQTFIKLLRDLKNPKRKTDKEFMMKDLSFLFQPFVFPFLYLTKQDLLTRAKENHWMQCMEMTWFCYNPVMNGKGDFQPCGGCVTCRDQYRHNFQWRIPVRRRILQKAYRFKKRLLNID